MSQSASPASVASIVVVGLIVIVIGRACESWAPSAPVVQSSAPSIQRERVRPIDGTGIERSINGDISIDPNTATEEAKRAFVLEMLQRQQQAADQSKRERDLADRLEKLERQTTCERSYRASEKMYRESGLTLAQVCP